MVAKSVVAVVEPGWVIALFVIEVIQRFLVFLHFILGALGICLGLHVVIEKFVVKQVIVLGFVQVVFVAHAGSWDNGRPV
jgi:hypothetical protein